MSNLWLIWAILIKKSTVNADVHSFQGEVMLMVFFLSHYRRIPDSFKNVVWPISMPILPQKVNITGLTRKDTSVVVAAVQFINYALTRKANSLVRGQGICYSFVALLPLTQSSCEPQSANLGRQHSWFQPADYLVYGRNSVNTR